ncbi:hypothetical protein SADUNF_Sadunf06G0007600 [Salix dunnii]|uniref:Wax synthase domain-containing protein n=1 Tax=Salix dunnii TaxID=1413687 RepID=A0A835JX12_9ROSI|nr:hypothetical protein SADUNF_Sadunf06G0007600 [Salix dunnii]
MGGGLLNFVMVWMIILALLCYCHKIGMLIDKGRTRLFVILPVISIFLLLPLDISIFSLRALSSFFLSWLASFKLLLFALDQGPLSPRPPLSLPLFIAVACLPIKIRQNPPPNFQELVNVNGNQDLEKLVNGEDNDTPSQEVPKKGLISTRRLKYFIKFLLLVSFGYLYTKEEYLHSKIILPVYVIHIYIGLELILAMVGTVARAFLRIELEPQFDEPYLASSLQDFWGKRWNLMVTSVLRPAVFNPVRSLFSRFMTKKWTPLPAAMASFLVSGIMHELIFYHIGRRKPTWEVTCFFLLHGVCLIIEIVIKRELNCSWGLPRVVAAPLVVGFVVVTAMWLFMPTVVRCKIDVEARVEIIAFINFVKVKSNNPICLKSTIRVNDEPYGHQYLVPNCIQSNPVNFYPLDFRKVPAVIATFLVSGLMHELIFYHIRSQKASVGGLVVLSLAWLMKLVVAAPFLVGFVVATSMWLSMPTAGRCKIDVEARMEIISFINF